VIEMKTVWMFVVVAVLTVGCGDKKKTQSSGGSPTAPTGASTALCTPVPFVNWGLTFTTEGPHGNIKPFIRVDEYKVEIKDTNSPMYQPHRYLTGNVTTFPLHFDRDYQIAGLVGGCWTAWSTFHTPKQNPTGNGDPAPPIVVTPIPPTTTCPRPRADGSCDY